MATVKMKKGEKYADIFDSPETIRQAQLDGYSLVENKAEVSAETPEKSEAPDLNLIEDSPDGAEAPEKSEKNQHKKKTS